MILAASGSPSANQFITGAVSGEVHLTGLPAKPVGSGRLNLVNGKIADREAQLATASVKFEGKNATLELLEVQTSPQRLTASGSMNLDDYSFKVAGRAERISLANFAETLELKETKIEGEAEADFQVSGKVSAEKQVDLDWEALKLELTAQGRGVKVNGRDTGELKLTAHTSAGGRLDAQLLTSILAANGKAQTGRKPDLIKASVELRAPGRPIKIESNLVNVDIAPLVDAFAPELNQTLKGAVTGSLRIEGPSLDGKGSPSFDRLRGSLTLMDVALLVADNPVKIETPADQNPERARLGRGRRPEFRRDAGVGASGRDELLARRQSRPRPTARAPRRRRSFRVGGNRGASDRDLRRPEDAGQSRLQQVRAFDGRISCLRLQRDRTFHARGRPDQTRKIHLRRQRRAH
jgi:hypothetical protein